MSLPNHKGRPAIVMGGGPTLPASVRAILVAGVKRPVWLSANEHGALLVSRCHYIVTTDLHHQRLSRELGEAVCMGEVMRPLAKRCKAKIISRRPYADILYQPASPPFNPLNAGFWAILAAYEMGCSPIYVAGFDCWVGGTYYHDANAWSSSRNYPRHDFERAARTAAKAIPDADIRVVGGGPLLAGWPQHKEISA